MEGGHCFQPARDEVLFVVTGETFFQATRRRRREAGYRYGFENVVKTRQAGTRHSAAHAVEPEHDLQASLVQDDQAVGPSVY